jgi:hypothetical protein
LSRGYGEPAPPTPDPGLNAAQKVGFCRFFEPNWLIFALENQFVLRI